MADPISNTKRSVRNGAIIAVIISAIGLYQGETAITAIMTFFFSWIIISAALWLSYKITTPKPTQSEKS